MKILIAPDSFKGSLSSRQVIEIISGAVKSLIPDAQITSVPAADGGEGTVEALCGQRLVSCEALDPLGKSIDAVYGLLHDTAVIEMASASGLPLVPPNERDPRNTSTFGTGQLILDALKRGYKNILIGIGGSATNDGGMGALSALGVRFLDENGCELAGKGSELIKVRSVDKSGLTPLIRGTSITVMCDVTNPLLGENGATHVYGPQKGASDSVIAELERGMENYAEAMKKAFDADSLLPGAGAAGGLGFALSAIGGRLIRGVDAVFDTLKFNEKAHGADLIITGEGRLDSQSLGFGKLISGVISRAKSLGDIPVLIIAGSIMPMLQLPENTAAISCVDRPMELSFAMENAAQLLYTAAHRALSLYLLGKNIGKQ